MSPAELSSSFQSPDPTISMSCDTEPHRPIRLDDHQEVARQPSTDQKGAESLVNEEVIHQKLELSQKLRIESLSKPLYFQFQIGTLSILPLTGKSTDEELLDLMLELAGTQVGMATQGSDSAHQSQTVVDSFCDRLLARSQPSLSQQLSHSSSLRGRLSSYQGDTQSQPPVGNTGTADLQTRLTGSQPGPSPEREVVDAGKWQDVVEQFLVSGEDLLNRSDEIQSSKTGFAADESTTAAAEEEEEGKIGLAHKSEVKVSEEASSPVCSLHSPVFSDADLFDPENPLTPPPSPPPSSLPLSPPPRDDDITETNAPDEKLEDMSLDEQNLSVMLTGSSIATGNVSIGSKSDESENEIEVGSELGDILTSAQPLTADRSSNAGRPGLLPDVPIGVRRSSSDRDSTATDVQLEFEMPEISMLQFQTATTEILGTPSKMSSGREERVNEESGGVNVRAKGVKRKLSLGADQEASLVSSSQTEGRDMMVAMDDGMAAAAPSQKPKRTSTPFRRASSSLVGERGEGEGEAIVHTIPESDCSSSVSSRVEMATGAQSLCLSSSQRRTLIEQLFRAGCHLGDSGEGGEGGEGGGGGRECVGETDNEEEEEEEDDEDGGEWMSGELSTPPTHHPREVEF